ncbi:MAG: hypothetical protein M3378_07260 [Actinomycetota bacterium]|nr:hypothetical protein [Actinomycetota bacterium]MDQ3680326.1 hypothetical protein [Actinomycetota bacterium]
MFCENRQLAQEWAYRFLGASAAYADVHQTNVYRYTQPSRERAGSVSRQEG